MSPTVFRYKGYRFFFFSREEERMHIHVIHENGEAKFWMKPKIALACNYGLNEKQITEIIKVINEKEEDIINDWNLHFRSRSN